MAEDTTKTSDPAGNLQTFVDQQREALDTILSPGPQSFNFNASRYRATRSQGEPLDFQPIEHNPMIDEINNLASELLTGELPQDVVDQIKREDAEKAQAGGLTGQIARNLTARDLGLTSLDLKTQGASLAAGAVELGLRETELNRTLELQTSQFNESIREWNDKFATLMVEADQNSEQLRLAALELESVNRRFMMGLEKDLIVANSTMEIPGLQDIFEGYATSFEDITGALGGYL